MAKRKPSQSSQEAFPGTQADEMTSDTNQAGPGQPPATAAASPAPIPYAAQPASNGITPESKQANDEKQQQPHSEGQAQQVAGNVPALPPVRPMVRRTLTRERLMKLPEWPSIKATLAEMRSDPKLAGMSSEAREQFIWAELDRLYPPITPHNNKGQIAPNFQVVSSENRPENAASPQVADSGARGGIVGLGDVPANWPALPGNTSLAAEIGWVQANRLYVVEERPGGATQVRLERAHEPAPSRAAIGWLETSIRSYAKFVEVAAKASSTDDDEQTFVRRERAQIEEIRSLLTEMLAAAKG